MKFSQLLNMSGRKKVLIYLLVLLSVFFSWSYSSKISRTRKIAIFETELTQIEGGHFNRIPRTKFWWRMVDLLTGKQFEFAKKRTSSIILSLDLSGPHPHDEILGKLPEIKSLNGISFKDKTITDETFSHLSKHPQIKFLQFHDCKINAGNLLLLKDQRKLLYIGFFNCSITVETVKDLGKFQYLEVLSLVNSNIPDAVIQELKATLPNCRISLDK